MAQVSFEKDSEGFTHLKVILREANTEKPTQEALDRLRQALKEEPDFWRLAGDLGALARKHLLADLKNKPGTKESIERGLSELEKSLGWADASGLERLLIDQVLMCWLRLNVMEMAYSAQAVSVSSIKEALFWEKRLSMTQKRYMRACETLARVRKLHRYSPPLQLNIATHDGQQVNVAGALPGQSPPLPKRGKRKGVAQQ